MICANAISFDDVTFTVERNIDAGLEGDVVITFRKSNDTYYGTLYLPCNVDLDKSTLSWSEGINVESFDSGSTPVPFNGKSNTYLVSTGGEVVKFVVNTMQGSADVGTMFLNIDENKGTIFDMNNDPEHEKECTGVMSFDGEDDYYFIMNGSGNTTGMILRKNHIILLFIKVIIVIRKKLNFLRCKDQKVDYFIKF